MNPVIASRNQRGLRCAQCGGRIPQGRRVSAKFSTPEGTIYFVAHRACVIDEVRRRAFP